MALLGRIENLADLVHPGGRLRRALEVLRDCVAGRRSDIATQMASLQPGETRRIPVDGEALYLLLQCYRTKNRAEGRFEAHQRYTDLQYVWSGREHIEVCDLHACQPQPAYDASGNVFFPIGAMARSNLLVQAGEVAVLLPQDAHAPCLRTPDDDGELVRKIVVKVRDAHLTETGPDRTDGPGGPGTAGPAATLEP
jgi:YhcH/YjgK/YiaL family protein